MRQAWWRWTSGQATPPVADLAAIVRYVYSQGWLGELTDPQSLALLKRLESTAVARAAVARRQLIHAWAPQVRTTMTDLLAQLDRQLSSLTLGDGATSAHYDPPPEYVQQQVQALMEALTRQLLADLMTPRDVFADTIAMDEAALRCESFMTPHAGWPTALRDIASSISAQFEQHARMLESEEQKLNDADVQASEAELRERIERGEVSPASATAKRAHLFQTRPPDTLPKRELL